MSGKQNGFTFIELVIVMAMIALLLTIALPRYFDGLERAKEGVLKEDLLVMRDAIDQYYSDKGHYPGSLQALVSQRYIRSIPVDPITESHETWVVNGLADNPTVVFDVHSGAEGQASDGSFYNEW